MDAAPDLSRADPGTLLSLAAFFDHQAQRCRSLAREHEHRRLDAEAAARRRAGARKRLLRMGARLTALALLRGSVESAKAIVVLRGDWTREELGFAYAAWQRLRRDRRREVRNLEIWKAKLAGISTRTLAQRYRLSARQVDKIARLDPDVLTERRRVDGARTI